MAVDQEQRASGILHYQDQSVVQNLFDYAQNNGGEIRDGTDGLSIVTTTSRGRRRLSMEIFREAKDLGQVTIKLRRGRMFWHDNGSEGFAGAFIAEASILGPEYFHPTPEQRDTVLRKVASIFIPQTPQSE